MTHSKTLPRGVSFLPRTGKFKATLHLHGVRQHLGYFDTPEAAAQAVAMRKGEADRKQVMSKGNEAVQLLLGPVGFADLLQWAVSEPSLGGIIQTGERSEFSIWVQAAKEVRVDLKLASDTFSRMKEVVFDDVTDYESLLGPGPFVAALRHFERAGVLGRLEEINAVLAAGSRRRERMTLDQVVAALGAQGTAPPAPELQDVSDLV